MIPHKMIRFSCNTTPGELYLALLNEGQVDFFNNPYGPRESNPTDGVRYYAVGLIPKARKNGTGGLLIEYRINSAEIKPELQEFTDRGNTYGVDMSSKLEGSTTLNVQPVSNGNGIHVVAECGHEMALEHFEKLLATIAEWYPESKLASLSVPVATLDEKTNPAGTHEEQQPTTPAWVYNMSPDLQHWYYIVLQSEYERKMYTQKITDFCQQNGLNYDTYKSNKTILKRIPEFNIVEWFSGKKPVDAHERVIRAIKAKRAGRWNDEPQVNL